MLSELERAFEEWWNLTGQEFAFPSRPLSDAEFSRFLFLLCRVAYCQGRIDECITQERAALKQLSKVG